MCSRGPLTLVPSTNKLTADTIQVWRDLRTVHTRELPVQNDTRIPDMF